eukprot:TRINITY_DN8338_c0_g1_i1.p1 TRINITY_DN8338_c0_g1~~TRINITY_DN8338_c0_g1_i1.p1  ORF type:complete len:280 (-),score=59.70 TRINITY_DN8338_c0_g1_i1:385-1224(-)
MAEEHHEKSLLENVMEKAEKAVEQFKHSSSSSSSSDSEEEKPRVEKKEEQVGPAAVEEHSVAPPPMEERSVKSSIKRLFGREKPVHSLLGGGKAADVMLWRNKQLSASFLLGATLIWILFEVWGYHLLTLCCHVLMLGVTGLFIWSTAASFLNKKPASIPKFQLSGDMLQTIASALRHDINKLLATLHDVASGRDLKKFLMVIAGLWVLSVVGTWANFLSLLYITFIVAHTVPVVYEKYEDQIDAFAFKALEEGKKYYKMLDARVLSKIPKGPLKEKKF